MQYKLYGVLLGIVSLPVALNAEQNFFKDSLPIIFRNIAQGVEDVNAEMVAKNEVVNYSLDAANDAIDRVENSIIANTPFTHLELTLGSDAFGLDTDGTATKSEAMAVLRLHETKNAFLFNQTSIVSFDGHSTLNIGLGARHINDAETIIMGANAFYDYEMESEHKRTGFGVELLTSLLELRANKYNAVSGTINYNGIDETALDGHDVKITGNLPYFYSSNVYCKQSEFSDGVGYKIQNEEWDVQAEIAPNLVVGVAQQNGTGRSEQTIASVSFSIPLGGTRSPAKAKQVVNGEW